MRAPLDIEAIRARASYARIDYTEETGSTNADLVRAAGEGAPAWTAAVTEYQSAGRGRHGRVWTAPKHSQVTLSILIRPPASAVDKLGTMPLITGLALIDALGPDYPVALKWPNDVLLGGRKLCGILAEAASLGPSPAIVIGLGLNASLTEEELPVPHAISLEMYSGQPVDRTELVIKVLDSLKSRLGQWMNDTAGLMDDYRAVCSSIGQEVRVILPGDNELLGTCVGVADTGLLRVSSGGQIHELAAGDVTHLRLQ
ncbi:biotin--[acetyl-CoA-carboxylase] ligase [Staphylococcus chromogenes]|nr:biotin--[acetyl-CoA-carboxylase] ligase [Staphylococcus chromogenes]